MYLRVISRDTIDSLIGSNLKDWRSYGGGDGDDADMDARRERLKFLRACCWGFRRNTVLWERREEGLAVLVKEGEEMVVEAMVCWILECVQ